MLSDVTYSVSDFQYYFEFVPKKHGRNTNTTSLKAYVKEIDNKTTFKIKNGYSLKI